MIAYNFDFIAKFAVAGESKILIPLIGERETAGIFKISEDLGRILQISDNSDRIAQIGLT